MKVLLIFLSAVITLTVKTKNSVQLDGTWPYDITVDYACTYQKGDVRAGDTATLSLGGLDNIQLEAVKVYVRSNKSGGAGVITMTADGGSLYSKSGTYEEWFGSYNNTDYQPIGWSGKKTLQQGQLNVEVVGSANSLHIEKYEVTWSQSAAEEHTVTLMKGDEVLNSLTGRSVELPALADEPLWHFIGWTANPFYERNTLPALIQPGAYRPDKDITLWAVYEYQVPIDSLIATELESGVYVYADPSSGRAMSGGVAYGEAGCEMIDMYNQNQWYEVTFEQDSTATIQLMYTYDYIGYSGTQLAAEPSRWKVYHDGRKTAFYTTAGGKIYMLLPNKLINGEYYGAQLVEVMDITYTATALLSVDAAMADPVYTCHPEVPMGTEQVSREPKHGERIISFGIYELVIRDGKKYLKLKE